jgi:hypothetical protein
VFDKARQHGEMSADAGDLDLIIAFIGAVMGVGLLGYGLSDSPWIPPWTSCSPHSTGGSFRALAHDAFIERV